MEDLTVGLIKDIKDSFRKELTSNKKLIAVDKKIKAGTATYKDAYTVANEVGNARAKVLKNKINSAMLPDGKMYYNIADKVIRDSLETDYKTISTICKDVQTKLNEASRIGLKAQVPDWDEDGIMGFINRISSEPNYDDVAFILDEPLKVFERKIVDRAVEKNAKFQHDAGIKAIVIRHADSKCCKWCDALEGEYTYPGVPSEVFMRHDNCRCSLEYEGRKLTAYNRNFME